MSKILQREGLSGNAIDEMVAAQTISSAMPAKHDFLAPVVLPFSLPTPLYGAMLAIWHLRSLLQRRFPLHKGKPKDFVRYLAWCAVEGRRQYAILRSIPEWDIALAQQIAIPEIQGEKWLSGFSVMMFLYGVARYRYTLGPMLTNGNLRLRVARAFWRGERHRLLFPTPKSWNYDEILAQYGSVASFVESLRQKKRDAGKTFSCLVAEFGLSDLVDYSAKRDAQANAIRVPDLAKLPDGLSKLHLHIPQKLAKSLLWLAERVEKRPTEFELAGVTNRMVVQPKQFKGAIYPFGVNLFGYAKGEIGIGEDVRLVAQALEAHAIPFCIVNVRLGSNVSQYDSSVERWIEDKPKYAINIFCTTGVEQARYALENGLDVFHGRYNIGFWPWELPSWPASCRHAYSMVDEIWGISRYTAEAYRNSPRPVYVMSLPVTIEALGTDTRKDFGLPERSFLFCFSFDFNSTLTRKNPIAVVRAFKQAFPNKKDKSVGLVVKASHVNADHPLWQKIIKEIDLDPRIFVIESTLRREQVLALYNCCDCYVSLHRAEGFGRSLAESLLLGKQLITTGYSGNMDFCTEDRVGLVKYKLRELKQNEYFYAQGQCWAEPQVNHAAELMREIYKKPRATDERVDFSPITVSARYASRLKEIQNLYQLKKLISC